MNDLISRSEAIEALNQHYYETFIDYDTTVELLNELPSIDAVSVVHGRWETREYTTEDDWDDWGVINHREEVCSECGKWQSERSKFCSHCGARMDGEENAAD